MRQTQYACFAKASLSLLEKKCVLAVNTTAREIATVSKHRTDAAFKERMLGIQRMDAFGPLNDMEVVEVV